MEYRLTWLATGIVLLVSLLIGIGSSLVFRAAIPRTIWAIVISLLFMGAGIAAVLLEYSWKGTAQGRFLAQLLAIGAMLTGITYAVRDKA